MTDISALESYAGQLSEAAALATASAQTQSEIVNGDASTDVLVESGLVPTLAKQAVLAQAKVTASLEEVASQLAGSMTYKTTALGIAATQPGGLFGVLSPSNKEYVLIYENVANVPVATGKSYPSPEAVEDITQDLAVIADRSADQYYDGGKVAKAEADSAGRVAIAIMDSGRVKIPKLELPAQALTSIQSMINASTVGYAAIDAIWPSTALSALAQAARRRVDLVMIGDSNQLKDGYGYAGGFLKALTNRFGEYASTVGLLGRSGSAINSAESLMLFGAISGAPAGVDALVPGNYAYIADGATFANGANGAVISAASNLGVSNALRAHYSWISLNTGAGSFRTGVRLNASPFTTLVNGPVTNTNTGAIAVQRSYMDVPAGARTSGLEIKFYNPGGTILTGPFVGLYARFENVAKLNGVCVSTWYAAGGQSLYDMALEMNARSDKEHTVYFAEVRRLQLSAGKKPIVVVYINSGLNDKNETSVPSLGWRAGTVGDSPTNYIDNLEAITNRISNIWQINGWDETELFFLIMPSHPIATPDDSELVAYRKAAYSWAGNRARTSFVDLTNLTSYTEIHTLGYYLAGGTDTSHLTLAGYDDLSARVVNTCIPTVA